MRRRGLVEIQAVVLKAELLQHGVRRDRERTRTMMPVSQPSELFFSEVRFLKKLFVFQFSIFKIILYHLRY